MAVGLHLGSRAQRTWLFALIRCLHYCSEIILARLWLLLLMITRQDGTAEIARALAHDAGAVDRLHIVKGKDLPYEWVGKVWALEQGATFIVLATQSPKYLLLTDADIRHAPSSLASSGLRK